MGLSWLLLAITAVGSQPTEFRLETDTPDALCPELAMARDAVRKRLGTLEVEGGGTWHGRYSTVHDPTGHHGDYVRLVIVDPAGIEKAVRELPIRGESCATVAQAMALVIDGFFRDLGQAAANDTAPSPSGNVSPNASGEQPHVHSGAPPQTATHVIVSSESKSKPVARGDRATPDDSARAVGVSAGAGYESVPASFVGSLGLFAAITSHWRTDLRFGVPWSDQQRNLRSGEAHLRPFPLRVALTYDVTVWRGLRVFAGPELLVSFEQATTSRVDHGRSGWRAAFGAGVRGGVAYWILPRLALSAGFAGDLVQLNSRRFLLEDESEFNPARARLAGMFEIWGAIFP